MTIFSSDFPVSINVDLNKAMRNWRPAVACLTLLCALVLAPGRSNAIELSLSKGIIQLSGFIESADETKFKMFIRNAGEQKIVAVQLNSGGGLITSAFDIARLIRKNGYATIVDAKSGRCFSACTLLFVSGVRRAYLNATGIRDGIESSAKRKMGIGFHGANGLVMGVRSSSGLGTALMIGGYYEFGVPEAKDLITKADHNEMYIVSPETASRMGIATHLTALPL